MNKQSPKMNQLIVELGEIMKTSYDNNFYDWMGHVVEYEMSVQDHITKNLHVIPADKQIRFIFWAGVTASRYYLQRRETDPRDPAMWLPAGYHGSAHTCIIEGTDPDECEICKKQEKYAEEMRNED